MNFFLFSAKTIINGEFWLKIYQFSAKTKKKQEFWLKISRRSYINFW